MRWRLIALIVAAAMVMTACGGSDSSGDSDSSETTAPTALVGDATSGKALYDATCQSCHGPAGAGIEGLGKSLASSAFIADHTDAELIDFIKVGRLADDPENTTGVAMPPKGGNPALSEQDLADILAYLRTLQ